MLRSKVDSGPNYPEYQIDLLRRTPLDRSHGTKDRPAPSYNSYEGAILGPGIFHVCQNNPNQTVHAWRTRKRTSLETDYISSWEEAPDRTSLDLREYLLSCRTEAMNKRAWKNVNLEHKQNCYNLPSESQLDTKENHLHVLLPCCGRM